MVLAIAAAVVGMLFGAAPAGAAPAPATGGTSAIAMVLDGKKLEFQGPATVEEGAPLEVINETNPRQVGPHTFSLVTRGSLPKTKRAEDECFTPGKICFAIAKWHQVEQNTEKIGLNPVKAGPAGWSTAGDASGKRGDSWFSGETTPGTHITQDVSARAGTTLYYFCAIHPWMRGAIKVVPPAAQ